MAFRVRAPARRGSERDRRGNPTEGFPAASLERRWRPVPAIVCRSNRTALASARRSAEFWDRLLMPFD
jgi:hypothetical protein